MITGRQIRAARGLLKWRVEDLSDRAGLSREAISRIEDDAVKPREGTIEKILAVFDGFGVEFLQDKGVSLKDDRVREIDGPDCYVHLLDEVYHSLEEGDEFLVSMVDESISKNSVHEAYKRIIAKGLKYRKLIKEGNNHIRGPLSWYRHIEPLYYQNSAAIFFQNKSAYLTQDFQKVIIVRDPSISLANKNFYEMVWNRAKKATHSTAEERYD